MWRNADVLDFVGWLRSHDDSVNTGQKVGFYGLDLYSLHASIEAVVSYLDNVDPDGARCARYRYGCFEHFGEDPQAYGYCTGFGLTHTCESEVVAQLMDLQRHAFEYARMDGRVAAERFFDAEQNAHLVKDAEQYYRTMFRGRVSSWNLRDQHMAETLGSLVEHLDRRHHPAKVVVWAHNSHLGDARATRMGRAGELNVGQLVRQKYGTDCRLIGFSTYAGTVDGGVRLGQPGRAKSCAAGAAG
jgi:erythromycin esterase-like protein